METARRLPFNLVAVVAAAVALANLSVQSTTARGATYDYVAPQVAPPAAANLVTAQIAAILNETADPAYYVAYQMTTTDASGKLAGLAPLKVVPTDDPQHPYLGVFHNQINSTQFALIWATRPI